MHRHDEHFAEHWLQRELCHLEEEKETALHSCGKRGLARARHGSKGQQTIDVPCHHDDEGYLSPPEKFYFLP
jgi:hypothetical protein